MTEEQKQPLLTFVGIFTGKEARRKFKNKAGVEGIVYGIKLKEDTTQQFGKGFTIYSNTKGFDKIQELDKVKVGYVIDKFVAKNGENATSNKVMWIAKTEEEVTKRNAAKKVEDSQEVPIEEIKEPELKIVDWENFKKQYLELMADNPKKGIHDMMGRYLLMYHDNIKVIDELRSLCSKALTPEVKQ